MAKHLNGKGRKDNSLQNTAQETTLQYLAPQPKENTGFFGSQADPVKNIMGFRKVNYYLP